MARTLAIMQPTFLPWLGYFALMDSVDEFVFLDNVQFDRRSWQQRNRIKTRSGPAWISVPVRTKGQGEQTINQVAIDYQSPSFPGKAVRAIEHNYGKAPYFETYGSGILSLIERPHSGIGELNISLIEHIRELLGINAATIRSSDIPVDGCKADRLVNICRARSAISYLSPPGSRSYIEDSGAFEVAEIPVRYLAYEHPVYPQLFGEFCAQLSVIDLLFNLGGESLNVLRKGVSFCE